MIATSGASRRVAIRALTLGDTGRSTTGGLDGCSRETSVNPVPCAVIQPDDPGDATPQPRDTDGRRRAATPLPSGRDGRRGARGVLPPVDFGQSLGHIGPLRVQRPRLLKGGGRVGPLPRHERAIPVRKGLEGTGLREIPADGA